MRAWGARILSSATTVEEARWLEARGVDAMIAQGVEAGGHRGMFLTDDTHAAGTFALVPQIVKAVRVPVIAAGGIADAAGVAAAMALGAAGVQVGTSYLLCPEATTKRAASRRARSDASRLTALTNLFTGRPARGIVNRLMRELGPMSDGAGVSAGGVGHRAAQSHSREPWRAATARRCGRVRTRADASRFPRRTYARAGRGTRRNRRLSFDQAVVAFPVDS